MAMEDMGMQIYGFAGGRVDAWEPEEVYWGPEGEWLSGDQRLQC
jgi:catalase-peroxidase